MRLKPTEIARAVLDELFHRGGTSDVDSMDAADNSAQGSAVVDDRPPDLIKHDKKYHHGHWDGKTKCKYREDREKAISSAKTDAERLDIVDKLLPEDVDGEEVEKDEVDNISASVPTYGSVATESEFMSDIKEQIERGSDYTGSGGGLMWLGDALKGADQKKKDELAISILKMIGASFAPKDVAPAASSEKAVERISQLDGILGKTNNPILQKVVGAKRDALKAEIAKSTSEPKVEAVKAFAAALGVSADGVGQPVKAPNGSSVSMESLVKEKESIEKDMDMIKEKMQLASSGLANALSVSLDSMEKRIKEINAALNGTGATDDGNDEAKRKEARRIKKEKIKAAIEDIKKNRKDGSLTPLDADVQDGKASVLPSAEFKQKFSALPLEDRIYAISDMHGNEYKKMGMSNSGTVIIGGDITDELYSSPKYNEDSETKLKRAQKWIDEKFKPFCDKHPKQTFVLIPGNHDNILGSDVAKDIVWPSNVQLLNDQETSVNGMKVYGTGICERRKGVDDSYFNGRPFELTDDDFKKRAESIPEGLDVLVIHQPPKPEGGLGNKSATGDPMDSYGSQILTDIIKAKKPKLVICGHLHDGDHRPFRIGDTVVVNCARGGSLGRASKSYTQHDIGIVRNQQDGNGFFLDGEDKHEI